MNLQEQIKRYPRAFKGFSDYWAGGFTSLAIDYSSEFWSPGNDIDHRLLSGILYDFLDVEGFNVVVVPEYYEAGINWIWSIQGYLPKEEWKDGDIQDGTEWYGDNGEHDSRESAEVLAFVKAFEFLENRIINGR